MCDNSICTIARDCIACITYTLYITRYILGEFDTFFTFAVNFQCPPSLYSTLSESVLGCIVVRIRHLRLAKLNTSYV